MTEIHRVNSSNIHGIGYDEVSHELHVVFANNTSYVYADVPADTYAGLRQAESKMKFLNSDIKGKFKHRRV
jgi:KTSC domain